MTNKFLEYIENRARYIKVILTVLPFIFTMASGLLWIDTRYMHKEMAEAQYAEIQLVLYTRSLKFYERKIDKEGYVPSTEETREYNLLLKTVEALTEKRNESLGLK